MKRYCSQALMCLVIVFSAAMISGTIDFKKKNIISIQSGHVNLGEVYSEKAVIDIDFQLVDDRFKGDSGTIFSIRNVPYIEYQDEIDKNLKSALNSYNKIRPDEKKLTMSHFASPVPSKLTIKAHTLYQSEHIPLFDLTITNKEIDLDKDVYIYQSISEAVSNFIKENKQRYDSTMFLN